MMNLFAPNATGFERVKVKVKSMKPIPADANPFHHDLMSMGTDLVRGWMVMHEGFDNKENPQALNWLYLVNTRTGQRIEVRLNHETGEPLLTKLVRNTSLLYYSLYWKAAGKIRSLKMQNTHRKTRKMRKRLLARGEALSKRHTSITKGVSQMTNRLTVKLFDRSDGDEVYPGKKVQVPGSNEVLTVVGTVGRGDKVAVVVEAITETSTLKTYRRFEQWPSDLGLVASDVIYFVGIATNGFTDPESKEEDIVYEGPGFTTRHQAWQDLLVENPQSAQRRIEVRAPDEICNY